MQRKTRLSIVLLLLFLLTTGSGVSAQQTGWNYTYTVSGPSGSPAGWVPVSILLSPSGCSGCSCGGSWLPNTHHGLMEKPGDRASYGHGQPGSRSPAWDGRATCPAGTSMAGELTAGTWYHNADFNINCVAGGCAYNFAAQSAHCLVLCSWGGGSEGWNFIESD
ncbi:MAG: hypothetical protein U9Q70_06530, partial [Chloroflexota bacterium]|nr:hypothetical protein [Chloroflexota bacterium]